VQELAERKVFNVLKNKGAVLVYIPTRIQSFDDVPDKAHKLTWELVSIIKSLSTLSTPPKLFVITDSVYKGRSPTALA
jgi:6-methylsalicylic acid synthase